MTIFNRACCWVSLHSGNAVMYVIGVLGLGMLLVLVGRP